MVSVRRVETHISQAGRRTLHICARKGSMNKDAAVPPAMAADSFNGDGAEEEDLATHRPNLATNVTTPPNVYRNASLATEASAPSHDPVLGASVSMMVAGVSVMEQANAVSDAEIGPGSTLGYHSLDDYKFVMSLVVLDVLEEEN